MYSFPVAAFALFCAEFTAFVTKAIPVTIPAAATNAPPIPVKAPNATAKVLTATSNSPITDAARSIALMSLHALITCAARATNVPIPATTNPVCKFNLLNNSIAFGRTLDTPEITPAIGLIAAASASITTIVAFPPSSKELNQSKNFVASSVTLVTIG